LKQNLFELDVYGFTILEEVLSPDDVSAMKEALIQLCNLHGEDRGDCIHISNLLVRDPIFFKVIDHPKVLPLLEACMGHVRRLPLIIGSLNARIVRPGDPGQRIHGDILDDLMKMDGKNPVMMNTVWMLDDFIPEIGATRIVPGSHKSGMSLPPEEFELKHIVAATALAGSVLIFNGQCWHGGGANIGQIHRHAIFGHYRIGPMMRFQYDPHQNFPAEWLELLTDKQKQLMRMQDGVGKPHGADEYE
jgi:hypothetical protein